MQYVSEGEYLIIDLLEFQVEEVGNFLLLVEVLVELPALCLVDEADDAGPVEAVVLVLDELEVGLAVGLVGQVVVLNLHQKPLHLLVVLVDQLVDLLPQALVELADPLEVGLDQRLLGLPDCPQPVLDLRDELEVSLGVLVAVAALAALAEEEVFLAVLREAEVSDLLLVALANPEAHLNNNDTGDLNYK